MTTSSGKGGIFKPLNNRAVEKSITSGRVNFGIGNHPETKVAPGAKVCVTEEIGTIVGVISARGVSVARAFEMGVEVAEFMISDGIEIVD